LLAPFVAPSRTVAQDERDSATARALFEQGVELARQSDWAGAADRFARSNDLRRSPVVAYNLAAAWIELGRLVEAAELLRQIERDPGAKPKLKKDARERLEQLEPRLATLVVTVESERKPEEVRVNDRALPEAALGVPTPVDPGTVEITVVGGGAVLWSKQVEVLPGGSQRVTIELPTPSTQPAPEPTVAPTPRATAAALSPEVRSPALDDTTQTDESGTLWEEPWLWIGVAIVVAGTVTVVLLASSGGSSTEDPIVGTLEPGRVRVPE
jgi:hypothetical protein